MERYSHRIFSPRPSRVLPSIEPLLKLPNPCFPPSKEASGLFLVISTITQLHLLFQCRTHTFPSNTLTIPFHHTPSPHLSSFIIHQNPHQSTSQPRYTSHSSFSAPHVFHGRAAPRFDHQSHGDITQHRRIVKVDVERNRILLHRS